ncbi:MAG: DUF2779 domain-containing protein [Candidatus Helarchaeota archaeon]|nr:DUF2779 domain-containing protein [candidate division Zixibacteria bacterium]
MSLLTKTKYLNGLQCSKLLWVSEHDKARVPEPDISTDYNFEQGIMVGNLAKQLYPGGIDLASFPFGENLEKTQELLDERLPLFEAGFKVKFDGREIFSKIDILLPVEDDQWDIIEVKSSTKVKAPNIEDVSFQKFCLERAGLKIRKCHLMHINNQYVRNKEIEVDRLLVAVEVTDEVEEYIGNVEQESINMLNILDKEDEPDIEIGDYCNNPYECPLKQSCWAFLPEGNVFELYKGGKKSFELLRNGIKKISDIPEDIKLSVVQNIQRECAINDVIYLNTEKIKSFLDDLKYPLYYLDFETINPAVPRYSGIRPYQKVPFQYSLHIQKDNNIEPEHISFLADGTENPIPELLKTLSESLGNEGDIIVYNASFEKGVLKDCCSLFPEYTDWYENNIEPRIKDLLIPFRSFHYYDPRQKGSASIKDVLPVLSDVSYADMDIADGSQACIEYERVTFNLDIDPAEKASVREALEEYCKLDTYAEILIIKKLMEKIN